LLNSVSAIAKTKNGKNSKKNQKDCCTATRKA